jgi:hypothetical protein
VDALETIVSQLELNTDTGLPEETQPLFRGVDEPHAMSRGCESPPPSLPRVSSCAVMPWLHPAWGRVQRCDTKSRLAASLAPHHARAHETRPCDRPALCTHPAPPPYSDEKVANLAGRQKPVLGRWTVALGTGYTRREGNRRASRNGRVIDLPPETPNVNDSQLSSSLY